MNTAEKLSLVKKLSSLTQEKLAQKLGVSFVTLNSWINGKSLPRNKKLTGIDELYARYSGTKIIPENLLQAKKDILAKKSRGNRNILKTILENPDIFDEFMLSLTYNSNRIEGSRLTEDETADILFRKSVLPDRTLVEQLEVKNHQTALEFLFDYVNKSGKINESFILRLHAILMNSIRSDAGTYRNHGVRIVGSNVPTANYLKVPMLMKKIAIKINQPNRDKISHCARIHSQFEQIHPFSDGNGRTGRLIMHAMTLKNNFPPAVIRQEKKKLYLKYLNIAQLKNDPSLLEDFVCDAVLDGFVILER
jgi:Fic family protein